MCDFLLCLVRSLNLGLINVSVINGPVGKNCKDFGDVLIISVLRF